MSPPKPTTTILVAISGPSCSGKTTLARLLRDALTPHAFILHEDDFYLPDSQIPLVRTADGRELADWDCLESINVRALEDMLAHIRTTGSLKSGFDSQEDQNELGTVDIDEAAIADVKKRLKGAVKDGVRIAIVDGFLLFAEGMRGVRDKFDVRLLLTAEYMVIKRRREARKGYVTLDGFWEDPEGYVDAVVWPNYVKDHKFLYKGGDIDRGVDEEKCRELGIFSAPVEVRENMTKCFIWAGNVLIDRLKAL
ncbi:P-loop containing nucleoside triphosphate hydrolase protein [Microthyrium microscopicum]|uniref:P-loop containing nucleoside triphosphate hydrolase protein n=1 Tax=Microthyrium microscopicum TaxID=703497 RepID=A0A6A6U6E5_9PEZI|nr:P-loop containing nucleoside triphosphate hydrolase protein [Microthyrium microscopicum]